MAKKVRSRSDEPEETSFEFPVFDERAFIVHELELTYGMVMAVVFAIVAGIGSAFLTVSLGGLLGVGPPIVVGLAAVVATPFVFPSLRPAIREYTRSDWTGLIALELFAWLGVWFLVAGVLAFH